VEINGMVLGLSCCIGWVARRFLNRGGTVETWRREVEPAVW